MSLNKEFSFFQTIRFKLTLLYSVIVFFVCGGLVLALNIFMNSYLQADPMTTRPIMMLIQRTINPDLPDDFNSLQINERDRIRIIRLNDLKEIQELSITSLFPLAIVSFIIGFIVSGRFLKPIDDLKHNIDNLTRTDLGRKIPVKVEDEVGGLIMSFNELSVRLKESFDTQERFVQDASHELKTPLTIIQTNLDTILDDPTSTKEELQSAITKSLNGVKSLKLLTNYLLDLTISQQKFNEKLNLTDLLKVELEKLQKVAVLNKVSLKFDLPNKEVFVLGQEIPLARAIDNVIENAIKYRDKDLTETKSIVEIKLNIEKQKVILKIHDNGIGIKEEHIEKIFDRFYRVEKSRNKATGGFGLGLAISKKVILEHKGEISVDSKKNDTTFTISLPLYKEK